MAVVPRHARLPQTRWRRWWCRREEEPVMVVMVPTRVCTRKEEEAVMGAVVPRHGRLAFARGKWW
jgi:hypothetical protein